MAGAHRRVSRLDVRRFGDGNLPLGGASGLAGHDAERSRWRSIRWTLDGTHHRAFSRGRSLRRIDVRLARRPHRAGAFDVAEHFDLLDFHWTLLLRQRT